MMNLSRSLALLLLMPISVLADNYIGIFTGHCDLNDDVNSRHIYGCYGVRIGKEWDTFGIEFEYTDQDTQDIGGPIKTGDNKVEFLDADVNSEFYLGFVTARKGWLKGGLGGGVVKDKITWQTDTRKGTNTGSEPAFAFFGEVSPRWKNVGISLRGEYTYYEVEAAHNDYEMSPDRWAVTLGIIGYF